MGKIIHENKPPTYICECGLHYTHFDNHMLILKHDLWLSIANQDDILCDECIEKRLKRKVTIHDLWRNDSGVVSGINMWYIKKIFDDVVDEWHNSDSKLSIIEYLGVTQKEYEKLIKS